MVIEVVCMCVGGEGRGVEVTVYLIWLNSNLGLFPDKINQMAVIDDCVTTEAFNIGLIFL